MKHGQISRVAQLKLNMVPKILEAVDEERDLGVDRIKVIEI
jgi:hypothetical protein